MEIFLFTKNTLSWSRSTNLCSYTRSSYISRAFFVSFEPNGTDPRMLTKDASILTLHNQWGLNPMVATIK